MPKIFRPVMKRMARIGLCAIGAAMLGGCSTLSLYFHSQGYEESTAALKTQVDNLDTTAAFKTLYANAKSLGDREDAAVIAGTTALRDAWLTQLIDPIAGDWWDEPPGGSGNKPRDRLILLTRTDRNVLTQLRGLAIEAEYRTGAEDYLKLQNDAEDALRVGIPAAQRALAEKIEEAKKKNKDLQAPPLDCKTAAKPEADPHYKEIENDEGIKNGYPVIAKQCEKVALLRAYLGRFKEPSEPQPDGSLKEPAISKAAGSFLSTSEQMEKAEAQAVETQAAIDKILEVIDKPGQDQKKLAEALKTLIDGLKDLSAAAQLAGLTEVDNFLRCGLVVDLQGASLKLGEDEAVKSAPVKTDAAKTDTESESDADKTAVCTTNTSKTTDKEADGSNPYNKAISEVIGIFAQVTASSLAADRLKRVDANIVALSELRQRLGTAKATKAYGTDVLRLQKAHLYAMFSQYRWLAGAEDSAKKLPDGDFAGFADIRESPTKSVREDAAEALTSYVRAWNYGKIPAAIVDARLKQAERKFNLDVASVSATNYKAVLQPIADALATYAKGGITPDTVAQVLSYAGILTGIMAK